MTGADDDEGGENEIDGLGQGLYDVPEGYVQVRRHIAGAAHEEHKGQRRDELEQKLRLCGEAEILLFAQLLIVVQKADGAEDEREYEAEDVPVLAGSSWGSKPTVRHTTAMAAMNISPPMVGVPDLDMVPARAVLTDGLPGLYFAQEGHEKGADAAGD